MGLLQPLDWITFTKNEVTQPLHVVASSIKRFQPVTMSRDKCNWNSLPSLLACIRASMAVPGITGSLMALPLQPSTISKNNFNFNLTESSGLLPSTNLNNNNNNNTNTNNGLSSSFNDPIINEESHSLRQDLFVPFNVLEHKQQRDQIKTSTSSYSSYSSHSTTGKGNTNRELTPTKHLVDRAIGVGDYHTTPASLISHRVSWETRVENMLNKRKNDLLKTDQNLLLSRINIFSIKILEAFFGGTFRHFLKLLLLPLWPVKKLLFAFTTTPLPLPQVVDDFTNNDPMNLSRPRVNPSPREEYSDRVESSREDAVGGVYGEYSELLATLPGDCEAVVDAFLCEPLPYR